MPCHAVPCRAVPRCALPCGCAEQLLFRAAGVAPPARVVLPACSADNLLRRLPDGRVRGAGMSDR